LLETIKADPDKELQDFKKELLETIKGGYQG